MAILQMLQALQNAQPEMDLQNAMSYGTQGETPGVQSMMPAQVATGSGIPQLPGNPYEKSLANARAGQYQAPPQNKGMDFGTKDLIAGALPLVLALFAGKGGQEFAGGYAQGYLGGKQKGVDRNNENAFMQWQAGQQGRDAAVRNAELDLTRWERNQDQAADLAFRNKQFDISRQDQNQYRKDQASAKAENDRNTRIEKVRTAYNSAKGLESMQMFAKKWRELDPEFAPDEAGVVKDFQTRTSASRSQGMQRWEDVLKSELNQFGEVPTGRAAALELVRKSIATEFGIDPQSLRQVPTGATLAKQKQGEAKRQFDERLKFTKEAHKEKLAVSQGNLEVARGRLQVAEFNANTMRSALGLSQYRAAFDAFKFNANTYNAQTDAAIRDLDQKVHGAEARYKALPEYPPEEKAKAKATLEQLKAERDYLKSTKEPEIQFPDSMYGPGGSLVNPNYVPPGPQAPQPPAVATGTIGKRPTSFSGPGINTQGSFAPLKVAVPAGTPSVEPKGNSMLTPLNMLGRNAPGASQSPNAKPNVNLKAERHQAAMRLQQFKGDPEAQRRIKEAFFQRTGVKW